MTKPVADLSERSDADHPDQGSSTTSAWRAAFEGFSTLSLNPSPLLRKFRCELEDYSDTAVVSAWSSTARALAAATAAELHLHGADQLDTAPRIKSIRRGAQPWEQPDRPNQENPETPTEPSEVDIVLERPDGTVIVVTLKSPTTAMRLHDVLRSIAMETPDK
jgi:hypothetical protein